MYISGKTSDLDRALPTCRQNPAAFDSFRLGVISMRGGYRPGAGRAKGAQTAANRALEALPAEHDPLAYLIGGHA